MKTNNIWTKELQPLDILITGTCLMIALYSLLYVLEAKEYCSEYYVFNKDTIMHCMKDENDYKECEGFIRNTTLNLEPTHCVQTKYSHFYRYRQHLKTHNT